MPEEPMSGQELKKRCLELARAIDQFLEERNRGAPRAAVTTNPWQTAHFERLRYLAETGERYYLDFHPEVMHVYEALRVRGYTDSELESLLARPSTQGTIREIAACLAKLAERISEVRGQG